MSMMRNLEPLDSSLTSSTTARHRVVNGRAWRAAAVLATSLLLASCASTSSIVTGQTRPALTVDEVRLYTQPPPKYEEIGLIQSSSRSSFTFTDQAQMDVLVRRMKEEAAKLGANGVLLESTGDIASGSVGTGMGTGGGRGGGFSFGGIGLSTTTTAKAGSARAIFVPPQ